MMDPLFVVTAQYFLAALLLLSGLHKVININRFKQAVAAYQLVPASLINVVSVSLPLSELVTGALLLSSAHYLAGLIAASIFGVYFFAMLVSINRGRINVDCGCSFSKKEAPVSRWHLIRNSLLIAMAVFTQLPSNGRELVWFDITQMSIVILCLGLLYLVFESLLANRIHLVDKEI